VIKPLVEAACSVLERVVFAKGLEVIALHDFEVAKAWRFWMFR